MKNKLKTGLILLLYLAVYFAIQLPWSLLWFKVLANDPANWFSKNFLVGDTFFDIVVFLVFLLLIRIVKKGNIITISGFSNTSLKNFILAGLIGILSGFLTISFFKLPAIAKNIPLFDYLMQLLYNSESLIALVIFIIINSIFKEVLFRGVIYNELKESFSTVPALIIHSLLYGIVFFYFFGNITVIAFASLGAALFCLVYIVSKSIIASIIAQVLSSTTMCVLTRIKDAAINNTNAHYYLIISIIITSLLIFLLCKKGKVIDNIRAAGKGV